MNLLRFFVAVTVSLLIVLGIVFSIRFLIHRKIRRYDIEDSKGSSTSDHNLYYLSSSSKSKEPLSINVAIFEQVLLKVILADIVEERTISARVTLLEMVALELCTELISQVDQQLQSRS